VKQAIAIVIFLSLFIQCTIQLGVMGYYTINKTYIAKNLCENRNNPKMKCCGKCYLKKQLKKVDENNPGKVGFRSRGKIRRRPSSPRNSNVSSEK